MAKDLTKEILPIEEQKAEKKQLYKNWKLYASALGIVTIALAVGLGAGLSAQHSHTVTNSEHSIVNEINNSDTTTYTLPTIISGATLESITSQINGDFIKTKLTGDNATAFKTASFKFNKITIGEDNHDLTASDLTTTTIKTIDAKINYNYGASTNQATNLTITITATQAQIIVNIINDATYTVPTITAGNPATNITNQINGDFIKTKLTGDNATAFKSDLFKLNTVTVDGKTLTDSDLTTVGTINAKINYSYDTIIDQSTSLTITITANDNQITNAINEATYSVSSYVGDEATNVSNQINASFIKTALSDNIRSSFNNDSFKLNTITTGENNHLLANSDLETTGNITAKITYNYGTATNQATNLTIRVFANDSQIATAINNVSYNIQAYVGDTAANITNQINSDFIQAQLTDENDIATSFNFNSFKLDSITIDEKDLADSDLTTEQIINAKINYSYGTSTNQVTNLIITTKLVDQTVIINLLTKTTFQVDSNLGSQATDVTKQIDDNFIANTLSKTSNAIATGFKSSVFSLKTVTLGEDNHELTNADLGKLRILSTKINYTFNSKEYSSNLNINIGLNLPVNIGSLVNDNNKNFTLEGVTTASSDDEIKSAILKQVLVIAKDVLGDLWNSIGSLIESVLGQYTIITLDDNSPHQGATVAASSSASAFVTGLANINFTLATV